MARGIPEGGLSIGGQETSVATSLGLLSSVILVACVNRWSRTKGGQQFAKSALPPRVPCSTFREILRLACASRFTIH